MTTSPSKRNEEPCDKCKDLQLKLVHAFPELVNLVICKHDNKGQCSYWKKEEVLTLA